MRKIIILSFFILITNYCSAQELRARVNVISNRVASNVDKKAFVTLQTALNNFINNRKWSTDNFRTEHKFNEVF